MGFLICAACLFTFPKPDAFDVDEVRRLVERTYAAQRQPWSEVGGPYARVELRLWTPDFGIADATLTSIRELAVDTRTRRVLVRKTGSKWEIVPPN